MTIDLATDRAGRLVSQLDEAEVDLLLVTDLFNVRYLTGYTGSNGLALVGPRTRAFITDFRYVEQAAEQVDPSFDRREGSRELTDGIEQVVPQGPIRLGFELSNVTVSRHRQLRQTLPDRIELVGIEGLVERLRAVKEGGEVDRMREAAKLADDAFEAVIAGGLAGRTERDVAFALTLAMHERGAERPSFEAIVASGPHGALPHAVPREVDIEPGQLVVIDWGAQVDGYCSDCTRTVAAGSAGTREREIYQLVLDAQLSGLGALKGGMKAREVDAAARQVIEAAGHGEQFGHGLGHGVGLDIHEDPRLSQRSNAVLEAGNAVTIEPGVYLPRQFGVRIEDLVVVSHDGGEVLTSVSKELLVV